MLFLTFSSEVTTETRLYSYPLKYSALFLFYKVIFLLKDSFAVSYWSLLGNTGNWLCVHKYPVISHTLLLFGGASTHLLGKSEPSPKIILLVFTCGVLGKPGEVSRGSPPSLWRCVGEDRAGKMETSID